jgi:hypothetical protein
MIREIVYIFLHLKYTYLISVLFTYITLSVHVLIWKLNFYLYFKNVEISKNLQMKK